MGKEAGRVGHWTASLFQPIKRKKFYMETHDQIFAKKLIRYHAGMVDELEVHQAFSDAMRPRIKRLMARKKKEVEEGVSAFFGAVGRAVGCGVASEIGSAIGVQGSTITTLARAAFSKSKSTTKVAASKKPNTKTKKKTSISSASSSTSHQPLTKQSLFKAESRPATTASKTATTANPMSATSNVTSITKFKKNRNQKEKK